MIGCGAIARWHLEAIGRAANRTDVTAVIDVRAERADALAAVTGARPFADVEEALRSDVFDAALVMVPHDRHETVATAVLKAGRHLLLEKPMAPTLDACARILAAAEQAGTVFMVAENAQYWPEVVTAKRLVEEGAIGDVITARSWHCAPPMDEFYRGDDPWRLSAGATGGGIAIDTGSHWLRPLRMWLGEIKEVVAVTGRVIEAMEGESLCRSLCRFDSGVVASFDALLSPGPAAPVAPFQLTGTAGEIVVEHGRVLLYDGTEGRGVLHGGGNYFMSYEAQIADFEAAILDGAIPAASAEHAVGELRAALAMYRSAQSGRWESVW
jgi:UDP-N-acetyl-2-amino-2-deoxyglucuronate dehydrogenase